MLVKVGKRGQITIPKTFRKSLEFGPGDSIAIVRVNDELHLKPVKKTIFDFIGAIPASEGSPDWQTIREEARAYHAKQEMKANDE